MANPIETGINYLFSVANRTIGRSAWHVAMERPASRKRVSYENRPPWARDLNRAMDHGTPVYALAELLSPVTSRLMFPALDESEKLAKRHPIIGYATISLPLIADLALISACTYFSSNYAELGELLIIRNAVIHVSLDIIGAAAKRIRNSRPPTATTFVV